MAGHSKWANIRRHKEKQDAKKGKIYTKLIRAITVAARLGGDPNDNAVLRNAIDKGLAANMSRDVIDRAIKRGACGTGGDGMEEVRYEGYAPYGVAVMVECLTNNRNRTVSEIRHAFNKYSGNIGTDGSVAYLFSKQGRVVLGPEYPEELIMEIAIASGANDVTIGEDSIEILISPELLSNLQNALCKNNLITQQIDIEMIPNNLIEINNPQEAEQIFNLLDSLENLDDVQEVYSNANITTMN